MQELVLPHCNEPLDEYREGVATAYGMFSIRLTRSTPPLRRAAIQRRTALHVLCQKVLVDVAEELLRCRANIILPFQSRGASHASPQSTSARVTIVNMVPRQLIYSLGY